MVKFVLYLTMFFFIMELDAYVYMLGIIDIRPNIQVLIAFSFLLLLYFSKSGGSSVRFSQELSVLFLCLLLYLFSQVAGVLAWETIPGDFKLLFLWVYMILLLLFGGISGRLIGEKVPYVLFGILVVLVVITSMDTLFGGVSISQSWGRSASTLRNPNAAAFVIDMLMLGTFRWHRVGSLEICAITVAGIGVALTQSRGGLLAYFLILISLQIWWCGLGSNLGVRAKRFLTSGLFILVIASSLVSYFLVSRYGVEGIDVALTDDNGRYYALQVALDLMSEKPLFGHGTGFVYTQEVGPHNMMLRSLVENGVLGLIGLLLLSLGILWVGVVRRDPAIISLTLTLVMISMTTHNLTESRSILIIVGMLLAHSGTRMRSGSSLRSTFILRERRVQF